MSICIFFIVLLSTLFSVSVSGQKPTAYQVLQTYTLPQGILPQGVRDYDLNPQTGDFKVYFEGTCQFSIKSYKVRYKSTISGIISKGRITNLMGVSVKMIFFWLNISEVSLNGDDVDFSVGITSENFLAKYFTKSPQCVWV